MSRLDEYISLIEMFYARIFNRPTYSLSSLQKVKVRDFIDKNPTLDSFDYLSFIFSYRATHNRTGKVFPLNHIIGENALKRFRTRTKEQVYMTSVFLQKRGIQDTRKKNPTLSQEYLDEQRRMYFNTVQGFLNCYSFGGLLFKDEECKKCQFYSTCKENV